MDSMLHKKGHNIMSYSLPTSSSWFAQSERLSLEDFHTSIDAYISSIEHTHQALQEAYAPFKSTQSVLPFQCRKIIRLLLALNIEIHQCCQFLRETQTIPIVMIALRYQLLDELHYLKEQTDRLISYIYDMISPRSSPSLAHYVRELFDKLLQLITDIPQQVSFLSDEARFQEIRFSSITAGG
jgi:hypothetical protein